MVEDVGTKGYFYKTRVAGTYLDSNEDYLIERKKIKTQEEEFFIIKMKGWVPDVTKIKKEDENGCKCR